VEKLDPHISRKEGEKIRARRNVLRRTKDNANAKGGAVFNCEGHRKRNLRLERLERSGGGRHYR